MSGGGGGGQGSPNNTEWRFNQTFATCRWLQSPFPSWSGGKRVFAVKVFSVASIRGCCFLWIEKYYLTFDYSGYHSLFHIPCTLHPLLQDYAPPNNDRQEYDLEYGECFSQFYDILDSECSDEEINMLYEGNAVAETPTMVETFLTEADCYWRLSKFLEGMQDHYTFEKPGIQRLNFRWKGLVRRIGEPVSKHIKEQGLEFLRFSFRWFNCLLIWEVHLHLATRLWDTYLAEGDYLPDFVHMSASFLLTWSGKLQKLDFQEMVMFLQHLSTRTWARIELATVLLQGLYHMWYTMFKSCPSHFAS